jgi:hypothetical protein
MTTSLPRPVLIGLLGVVAIAGVFLLTRGRGGEETAAPPTPAPTTPAPAAPKTAPKSAAAAPTKPNESTRAPKSAVTNATRSRTLPAPVRRALDKQKVVALLIWNPRGTDDRSVKSAVAGLSRHGGKVAVFTDKPNHLARYTKITAAAEVTQTPTLIVVNRKGVARKATGYLDPETIEQYVVDALKGAP